MVTSKLVTTIDADLTGDWVSTDTRDQVARVKVEPNGLVAIVTRTGELRAFQPIALWVKSFRQQVAECRYVRPDDTVNERIERLERRVDHLKEAIEVLLDGVDIDGAGWTQARIRDLLHVR